MEPLTQSKAFASHIFREYDIRGIAEKDFNKTFAYRLGGAYMALLKKSPQKNHTQKPKIAVGQDCRLTSDAYAWALCEGLQAQGAEVLHLGVCPTPLTYFSVFHLALDGAIMVTGSHNPAEYNGFKIGIGKSTLYGAEIQSLKTILESPPLAQTVTPSPPISFFPIIPAYVEYVSQQIGKLPRKKIVIDAGNGTAGAVAPELFSRLGAQVIPLFCDLDGRFPNHHPDPTLPENLKTLVQTVLHEKADFGVAFDGDADRIGAVDEKGRILYGDELMVIFSRDILLKNPGATIISEVKSSHRLYEDIANRGGRALMWKTGHSLIKSKLKETGASLAGEMSGHMFFNDRYFGFDDALYAAARLYEIAARVSHPISGLLAGLPPSFCTPEMRVECEESLKFKLVEGAKKDLSSRFPSQHLDGIRVDFGDGWGLIRASNTQPVVVVRCEASSEERLENIKATLFESLQNSAFILHHPKLKLP